jgi:hypothetical protein
MADPPHDPPPEPWDPADPATWRFVSEVVVDLPRPRWGSGAPVVARREVVTAATDYAHAGDPAILLGMPPARAAAWWVDVLLPIHLARVATVVAPARAAAVLHGIPPPWEAEADDPLDAGNPLLPGMLEARSAAARVFLDALGVSGRRDG